jgi:hypothetical protein
MSIKVTLIDGTVIEKDDYEYEMVVPRLLKVGCKLWKLNENTLIVADKIAFVEDTTDYEAIEAEEIADILAEEKERFAEVDEEVYEEEVPVKKKREKSPQERADEQLALMKELSSCKHKEYDMYYSESLMGRNKKPTRRYFPVCKKCGIREKYVKTDAIPDEVKVAAKLYDK